MESTIIERTNSDNEEYDSFYNNIDVNIGCSIFQKI